MAKSISESIRQVTTQADVIGDGPPLVVVSGGPGFSCRYMKEPFSFLQADYTTIYYEQPGCAGEPVDIENCSLETVGQHLAFVLDALSDHHEITVVSHSWGSIQFLQSLKHAKKTTLKSISRSILVNPMPWNKDAYEVARGHFIEALTPEASQKFLKLMDEHRPGHEVMEVLLPFYSPNPLPLTGYDFEMDPAVYTAIDNSQVDFDFSREVETLNSMEVILGGKDFVHRDQLTALLPQRHHMTLIEQVGHFPFYEAQQEFQDIVWAYLKS